MNRDGLFTFLTVKNYHGDKFWVARLIGLDAKYGFKREFLKWNTADYRDQVLSNGVKSRSYNFVLDQDGVYEVKHSGFVDQVRRYYQYRAETKELTELSKDEVNQLIQNGGTK